MPKVYSRAFRVAVLWEWRQGASVAQVAAARGVAESTVDAWIAEAGGMLRVPVVASGRYLTLADREEISVLLAQEVPKAEIARRVGFHRSTIGREIARNQVVRGVPPEQARSAAPRPAGAGRPSVGRPRVLRYRAVHAQRCAEAAARRPKTAKLAVDAALRAAVAGLLQARWSPQQIAAMLPVLYPDQSEMRVSHETIYQSLYVQGRGALRRELTACLRTGRAVRRPRARVQSDLRRRSKIPDMINISQRPAEAADRAVPGHWEGDLIIGKNGKTAIGTLVERASRFVILLHLPGDHRAETLRDAMVPAITALPQHLRASLTWDQGTEMALHQEITVKAGLPIYFCDPHSPWQRGSNENTNGLLRQYFPKGTDLSTHDPAHLAAVAAELNARPRMTLGWATPAHTLMKAIYSPPTNSVATTG
jgi:transposase, IS30 family